MSSSGRRGRGRPRKNTEYDAGYHQNQKLDPTGEMFLRAENRCGGPSDPMHSFEESLNELFPGVYKNITDHPLYPYISSYSFATTPKDFHA